MTNTLSKLQDYLIETQGLSKHDFVDSYMALNNDLCLDSMDTAELIQFAEYKFKITISDSDAEPLVTLPKLADYIDDNSCDCEIHNVTLD